VLPADATGLGRAAVLALRRSASAVKNADDC